MKFGTGFLSLIALLSIRFGNAIGNVGVFKDHRPGVDEDIGKSFSSWNSRIPKGVEDRKDSMDEHDVFPTAYQTSDGSKPKQGVHKLNNVNADTQVPATSQKIMTNDPQSSFRSHLRTSGRSSLYDNHDLELGNYLDIDQGIEPESIFHTRKLNRFSFCFFNWFKRQWHRLEDKFYIKSLKRKLKRLFKNVRKKGLYEPEPPNRWEVLDVSKKLTKAMELRTKIIEDFLSHPLILARGSEVTDQTSRAVMKLMKKFEKLKDPTAWLNGSNGKETMAFTLSITSSIEAKLKQQDDLDSLDLFHLQLIKYLGYFNPQARQLFKEVVLDPGRGHVRRVWRRMISADQSFRDFPRTTSYPHRYHDFLEQINLESRELLRRKSLCKALQNAVTNPPPGFGRKEERCLRKIFGHLAKLRFITNWPTTDEGVYVNLDRLVKKCILFLENQVNFKLGADSIHAQPIKLVYLVLNHIYTNSKGDFATQILIENSIKRSIYVQKTIYAHVLLQQRCTPREYASMTLLEDINFLQLLTPGMRQHLKNLEDREIASTLSSELYKDPEMNDLDSKDLPDLWASYRKLTSHNTQDHDQGENHDLKLEPEQLYSYLKQDINLSKLGDIVSKSPDIWHQMREVLFTNPVLKSHLFRLLQDKFESIWNELRSSRNLVASTALTKFLYDMKKEISERTERMSLILQLEKSLRDKIQKQLISQEAVNDISNFIVMVENIWLEVRYSTLKRGAYNVCPVELAKASLQLIREYGFGKLSVDIHEGLVNLMGHLAKYDSTDHLERMFNLAFQDDFDYTAFAFFIRSLSEPSDKFFNEHLDNLDGLSSKMLRKLNDFENESTIYGLQPWTP